MSVSPQAAQRGNRGSSPLAGIQRIASMLFNFIPSGKLAAALSWTAAVTTTYILFDSLVNRHYWNNSLITVDFMSLFGPLGLVAIGYQFVITVLQRGYWNGDKSQVSTIAMGVETLTNAAAVFPFMLNIDISGIWYMMSTTMAFWPGFNPMAAFFLSILVGYLLAGAPEYLWNKA